jgi:hypothetical protein
MLAAADEDPWSYPELPTAAAAAAASALPTQHGQELRFGNMKIKVQCSITGSSSAMLQLTSCPAC